MGNLIKEGKERQAVYHEILRNNGYQVHFACGFKECKKFIKDYMKLKVK